MKTYTLTEEQKNGLADFVRTEMGKRNVGWAQAILHDLATLPTAQAPQALGALDRNRLTTLIGATIMAHQPILREYGGKYELDFNNTVPALVEAILSTLGHQQPVSVDDLSVEIEKASASWPEQATCNLSDWIAGHLHAVFFPVTLGHREEAK